MVSRAQDIRKELISHINLDDTEWVRTLSQFDIGGVNARLQTIFDTDFKSLANRLNTRGLSHSYQRMLKDVDYLIQQAYLRADEKRQTPKTQIQFVLGRLIICRRVASQLLEHLQGLFTSLIETSTPIFTEGSLSLCQLNAIFKLGKSIDESKGYEREIQNVLDDYCHLLDFIYKLLGDKSELYGTRLRADIYAFQIEYAIRQLLVSRTESCDAAALMVRSLLEVQVRRSIFREGRTADFIYSPKKSLDVPTILEYCRRNGLEFQYSNEVINAVWDNLNLVVHFGFQLSPEVLWYIFWIARETHLVSEGDENSVRQQVRNVLENLTAAKHIEKLDVQTLRNEGLTIYWRY